METLKPASAGSLHAARITKSSDGRHYALIVRLDNDGTEHVLRGFARFYASQASAARGVRKYATKHGLRLAPAEARNESADEHRMFAARLKDPAVVAASLLPRTALVAAAAEALALGTCDEED